MGGDARPRPDALRGGRRGRRREPARRGRARRLDARASSSSAPDAQLDRRCRGPRLRARLPLRGRRSLHAPLSRRRGDRPLGELRVRLRPPSRDRRDRVVDDAPEAQPRRRRARAREGGDGDRPPRGPPRDDQGPSARLRPRPAGGQDAGVLDETRDAPRPRGADGARERARGRSRPHGEGGVRSSAPRDRRCRGARPRRRALP